MAPERRQQAVAEQRKTNIGRIRTISHGKIKIKSHGKTIIKAKSDKPHDTCFTLSQDQKFFVPADCDENTFQIICTLVKAQINKAKQIQKKLMK